MSNKAKSTLTVADDLCLTGVSVPEIPPNVIFPDDLNKYLRDQIQYLTHENGMLYKNVSDLEQQLQSSSSQVSLLSAELDKIQTINDKSSTLATNNLASTKIVELSKQLRERTSELEAYKTKLSKLHQYTTEIEKNKVQEQETITKNESEEQIKTLQDKLNSSNTKLCEVKNVNAQLKTNLKLANKLLQQEIGESFENLQTLVSGNGKWRGRAQIVCDLQQKLVELREKLKAHEDKDNGSIRTEAPPPVTKWDKKLATLTEENAQLQTTIQDIKRKLDAVRARNKVVESDNCALKVKYSTISEQYDHDRDMITGLTAQVTQAQDIQNEAVRQKQHIIQELEQTNNSLHLEIAKQTCKINNLNAQIEDQKREIENFRSKAKNLCFPLEQKVKKVNSPVSKYWETERMRLVELTKITNEKLDSERNAHSETHLKYLAERQKAAKLEAKVARLQLERHTEKSNGYSSRSMTSLNSVNDDKLELAAEKIKALQTRLDIERQEHKNSINEFSKILSHYEYLTNKDKGY